MDLSFVIVGPRAAEAEPGFKQALSDLQPGVPIAVRPGADLPAGARKVIDPIAVIALIVSIPSAVLAVIDIVDRIKKRRQAQNLIDAAKSLSEQKQVDIFLVKREVPRRLIDMSADEILDIADDATPD